MKTKKRILPALLFSIFAAAPAAQAQQFSNVVVFGDSLSDAGFYRPVLAALGVPASLLPILGRFTTAPGPVYSELITSYYGFTPSPSNLNNGFIFAQGGARVAVNSTSTPPGAAQRPVSTQVTEFLARGGGAADPNALYIVWAGANDVIQTAQGIGAGTIPADQASGIIQTTAAAEIQQIGRLRAAGARYVVVFGLPDIGATPAFIAAGAATAGSVTQLSAGYNTTLFSGLAQAGIRVIPVDAFAFLTEVRANPSSFGFTNITTPACRAFPPFSSAPDALFCPSSVWLTADANQTFLFADGIHPTTAAHAILAQFVEGMIDGPTAYGSLAEVALRTRASHQRTLADAFTTGKQGAAGWSVFAAGDRGNFDVESGIGLDSTNKSVTVGATARLSEAVSMGLAVGASESDGSFGRSLGSFKTRETVLSLFGTMKWNGLYGSAIASISDVDFRDLRRNIALGPMVRTASGSTGGSNASALLSLGYDFSLGRFRVGPLVSVSAQNVEVNGFDESGANSSNLRISGQKRRSEVWSAGVRASMNFGGWTPWLRVTADTERRDEVRFVTAAPLSMASGNSFEVPVQAPDKDYMTAAIGIHGLVMDRLGLSVSYYKVSGRSGIKEDGIGAMLSYRF